MKSMKSLFVEKNRIVNEDGDKVRLRGVCVGGFLNMEHFINGYPGYETSFRNAISSIIGEDKATSYFEIMQDNFLSEEDFRFLESIGVNAAIVTRRIDIPGVKGIDVQNHPVLVMEPLEEVQVR